MKQSYIYKVVEHNQKFSSLFNKIEFPQIGQRVSVHSLFENNKTILLKMCNNKKGNALVKSQKMITFARDHNMIERIDEYHLPEWFRQINSIQYWQSQLRGNRQKNVKATQDSTKIAYLRQLWNFNKWLTSTDPDNNNQPRRFKIQTLQRTDEKTFIQNTENMEFKNVEYILNILEGPFIEKKTIIRIIKQYLLDERHINFKASTLVLMKAAIVSYFEKNEQEINFSYDPSVTNSKHIEEQSMSLSDLMKFLTVGKPSVMEKALFLCKFHRGLDRTTLVDRFNFEAWEQLVKYFGSPNYVSWDLDMCPVPISLIRIKVDYKHIGFLDRDAIYELQTYLDFRKKQTGKDIEFGDPIFLNKFGNPITDSWLTNSFHKIAVRAGILKIIGKTASGKNIYNMDSHELRDLLKSTLINCKCSRDIADHVMGHKPKDSYEKQSLLYPDTIRLEYAKASKKINIFTKISNIMTGKENPDELIAELNEKSQEMSRLLEKQKEKTVTHYQDEFFAQNQQKQMESQQEQIEEQANMLKNMSKTIESIQENKPDDLLKTVNDLKNEIKSLKGKKLEEEKPIIEFCCIDCKVVHDKAKCPACGSTVRRIYGSTIST